MVKYTLNMIEWNTKDQMLAARIDGGELERCKSGIHGP